jgi:hypothetical protein
MATIAQGGGNHELFRLCASCAAMAELIVYSVSALNCRHRDRQALGVSSVFSDGIWIRATKGGVGQSGGY